MTKKIKLKINARLTKKRSRRTNGGQKVCRFCSDKTQLNNVDYKNTTFLRSFLTERSKILPSRISGTCALHQRKVSLEIRKSRVMALFPYTGVAL